MISRPSNPTSDDLARLISAGPDERVAFAPANAGPAKLAETLAALANTHGGVLLVDNAAGRPTASWMPAKRVPCCKPPVCWPPRR